MAHVTEAQVLDALRKIQDPDFKKDIVTLGFVKNLKIDGGKVAFTIELTTPACPVKAEFERAAKENVGAIAGVTEVAVTMTANVQAHATQKGKELIPGVKNVVAVASGKGGVGKSTTAVNLALALAQSGAKVGILDADIYGPSIPQMLGISGRPDTKDGKTLEPMENYGIKAMSIGFLVPDDTPMIWRGPMVMSALNQLLRDTNWGELDYLVVDLPPGTGDAQLSLAQQVPVTGAVIVSTPQEVALLDVRKGVNMFRKVEVPILGIVENMAYFVCDGCDKRHYIFDHGGAHKAADSFGVPFLGEVPLVPEVREDADAGRPIVIANPDSPVSQAYRDIAGQVAAQISKMQKDYASLFPKIVVH
ncbi:MAG: iron-sulfur cluster carrier protein ApbC [Alphaproteobacteria bacterium CG_4_10_14_0_2_um_filter_63_37]|nr:MAG: hypothetical protein AUJ55_03945 [Proteobacteria bacterium CG1_02_64_396]PJA24579.1 MAG: iron-sulfur cluster carrier protein ApbC [Alphaproteobacteria bacterium CG_4_10_14_0_2_um_filter_63_37]